MVASVAILALVPVPSVQAASTWPARPIRIIVTFPPGGSSDIVARLISSQLSERVGQAVVVDNRPGAGGTLGATIAAQAQADGHTLVVSNTAPFSVSPFIYPAVRYDPVKGFTHIASIGAVPNVLAVSNSLGAKSVADLVAVARSGRALNYGSSGVGSVGHIVGELFQRQFKVTMTHVPYKGARRSGSARHRRFPRSENSAIRRWWRRTGWGCPGPPAFRHPWSRRCTVPWAR
jgi:tripartite-type tricarboxylate transporter receptor subunit TctC